MFGNLFKTMDFHEVVLLHRQGKQLFHTIGDGLNGKPVPLGCDAPPLPLYTDLPLMVRSVPSYLDFQYSEGRRAKTVNAFPGSLLNLKNYSGYEAYLIATFKGKKRAQFRNSWGLLQLCFGVRHTVYYGDMEKTEFDTVFQALRDQHTERMQQMGVRDDSAGMWDLYRDTAYPQILGKEACLSVIYHGIRPIATSLNFILGGTVHGFARSFDPAYGKFGLGNMELLKMIQWCFEKDFDILDFMKGEEAYKSWFTDTPYWFTHQFLYDRDSMGHGAKVVIGQSLLGGFYLLFRSLKSMGVDRLWRQIGKALRGSGRKNQSIFKKATEPSLDKGEYIKVPWEEISNPVLKKSLFEFCHAQKKPLTSIGVYRSKTAPEHIKLIQGNHCLLVNPINNSNRTKNWP